MTAIRTHMRLTYGIQVRNKVSFLCVCVCVVKLDEVGLVAGEEGLILSHLTKQSCSGIS